MRKPIGIFFGSEEALALLPMLATNPEVELSRIYDPSVAAVRERLPALDPDAASVVESRLTDDAQALAGDTGLYAVVDASPESQFSQRFPEVVERGVQVVTPLTARLLWGYAASSDDHKVDLLQALHEVVESYKLTVDTDELFTRMLEIAIGVTGADGGSLMLLDPERRELRVRVAAGLEPELWPKIRVPIGEGIAGRVAAEARSLRLRGRADRQTFHIVQDRLDVESALCVPIVHEGRVLGVLNLHHGTRPDAFSQGDLEFTEQLAYLDAQIIARAQEHEAMRSQAVRYGAVRCAREILTRKAPFDERLRTLCRFAAERAEGGIATVYLCDPDDDHLRLAATSLQGGGLGGEYRVELGQGIDGTVARTGEACFLRTPAGVLAYAALPLIAAESLIGVLSVQAGPDAPRGRAVEETFLEIAAATAEEIAHAEREARLTARSTKASAINESGIRMISTTDVAELLRVGTAAAAMVLEADHAILRLREEDTGRYVIRSYYGAADGRLQEKLFRLDKLISVDTIKQRASLLVREIAGEPTLHEFRSDVRSVLAAPLLREGRVIGTLALYDKLATDRFYPGRFNDEDRQLVSKFTSYFERALGNALFHAHARQYRNFDEETGLPNQQYLGKRIHEEIARAGGREEALTVAVCRVDNLGEIEQATDAAHARRVVDLTIEALRAHLREFDVLGRTDDGEFTMLLPDPGLSPGEKVFALARAVADDVAKDDALNDPVRVALTFGYAVYPTEGRDRDALLERARDPRIRMV